MAGPELTSEGDLQGPSSFQLEQFLAIQMSKEHLRQVVEMFLMVERQSLLGKPKQRRQLSKDSAS